MSDGSIGDMEKYFLDECHCKQKYTIEPHGDVYALYYGRCGHRHGFNLCHISEVAHNCDLEKLAVLLNSGLKE